MRKLRKEIYYIGFNANNAICNENFFTGSITLYPTKEKGNIYFSSEKLEDTSSDKFLKKYREYVYENAKKIQKNNKKAEFICFNDKIKKLCADMKGINIVSGIDEKIIKFLNDKFEIRKYLNYSENIPTLDYHFYNTESTKYSQIKNDLKTSKFVLQGQTGAGGNNTFIIKNEEDFKNIGDLTNKFCVSKYKKNIPLNITIIISKKDIILLPISAQLIMLSDNKFKYVGGDFCYTNNLDENDINRINNYSLNIAKNIQRLGYRGVMGIDYILTNDKDLYFMEINPRFQSSSFLISLELNKYYNTSVAELHYLAINNKKLPKINIKKINKSFLNCNLKQDFNSFEESLLIENGYFKDNSTSFYRKVYNYSIVDNKIFENISK